MTLLAPAYRVTLGERRVDTTAEPLASSFVAIEVALALAPAADCFRLTLGRVGSLAPARGDEARIELGYADEDGEIETVLRGAVDAVGGTPEQRRVTGYGAAAALLRAFTDETFEETSAGEIVRELAERAGVTVARAEDGIRFPAYVIDRGRNLYRHCAELADLCGFDCYVTEENGLVFEAFGNGRRVHPLRHGEHVLDYRFERREAFAGRVEAWGESPGASAGAESWSWLTKDFDSLKGEAGGEGALRLLERSALRTAEAAQTAAEALSRRLGQRRLAGRVTVLGSPGIRLGDAVRLSDMPEDDLNAAFAVRALRHSLDKSGGFVTEVALRSLGEGP